jgi:RNA polymerase sigma-70 factor, ECF subfamily
VRGVEDRAEPTAPAVDDPGTFDAFARRERAALVAFGWSLTGSLPVAEELAQEALAAAWAAWDRVGGFDKPGAWARRVVANRAATRRRRAGREARALGRLWSRRGTDEIEMPRNDAELWRLVRRLPERQAHVVALHYVDDRSVAEIAKLLDCTEGTVKTHLHRARVSLARALDLVSEGDER